MAPNQDKTLFERLDWVNTTFLLTTPFIAVIAVVVFAVNGWIRWETILLSIGMGIYAGIGITGGYHRLFSHKTYEASWIVKVLLLLAGAAALQNSARKWSSDHRRHHKYVDTTRDPYNIKEGFWYAHIGWVLLKYENQSYEDVPDLINDPLVMWQEKYYLPLAILMSFIFPTAIASLWGDPWGGFFFAGLVRGVLNSHFTFSINSFAHIFGKQPYSDKDSSRDNALLAYVTYGEGYHNFHHKFPFDYRNGIKASQWDPTKWFIKGLSWVGLTRGLKQVPDEKILQARLQMDEKRLMKKIDQPGNVGKNLTPEFVASAREKFEKAYVHFRRLKIEYARLKKKEIAALDELKAEIIKARQHLIDARDTWSRLCLGMGISPTRASV